MGDELYPTPPTRVEVWASKNNYSETDKSPPLYYEYNIHSGQTFQFVRTAEQKLQRRVIECL